MEPAPPRGARERGSIADILWEIPLAGKGIVGAMMKEALLTVAALAAVIAVAEARVDEQSLPGSLPQRAYLCFEGSNANEVMAKANEAGARGWRLVAAAPGQSSGIWCFEQYGASRPAKAQ